MQRSKGARSIRAAVGVGVVAFVAYKGIKGLAALTNEDHIVASACSGRLDTKDAPHGHILGGTYFKNKDGLYIHYRRWDPTRPNGHVIVLVHGLGEHVGRYDHLAAALTGAGFTLFALDHQGHGRSEGDRAYVKSAKDYVYDVLQLRNEFAGPAAGPRGKVFLLGHSMGGLVSVRTALQAPEKWDGAVISAAALEPDPKVATPFMVFLAKNLAAKLPKLALDPLDATQLTRSKAIVQQYMQDPLVYHGGLQARLAAELLSTMDYVKEHRGEFKLPVLLQHGSADSLCRPSGTEDFFNFVGSQDKKKVIYEGWFHEIYNEVEPDCGLESDKKGVTTNRALRDAIAWLTEHASK